MTFEEWKESVFFGCQPTQQEEDLLRTAWKKGYEEGYTTGVNNTNDIKNCSRYFS